MIGWKKVKNIRHADNMFAVADSEEKLQRVVNGLVDKCRIMCLRINKGKSRVMGVTERSQRFPVKFRTEGTFRYLEIL